MFSRTDLIIVENLVSIYIPLQDIVYNKLNAALTLKMRRHDPLL